MEAEEVNVGLFVPCTILTARARLNLNGIIKLHDRETIEIPSRLKGNCW
jgi:hypothetical protein